MFLAKSSKIIFVILVNFEQVTNMFWLTLIIVIVCSMLTLNVFLNSEQVILTKSAIMAPDHVLNEFNLCVPNVPIFPQGFVMFTVEV